MKKRIINWYYYFFYKMYKLHEGSWLAETKATFFMEICYLMIIITLLIFYKIHINRYLILGNLANIKLIVFLTYLIFLGIPHYLIFSRNNRWKLIINKFDRLPKKKNIKGGWLCYGIFVFIFANFIYSFYQLSLINWSEYIK